ncbi:GNAT family N-acetyltransferase [Rhodococcus yananensis]|uniref:GNAT family N-acetyltransferase n=1 Tax=Rhodococcus yananensis TaxID=2879464 RepID=UPI001CF86432
MPESWCGNSDSPALQGLSRSTTRSHRHITGGSGLSRPNQPHHIHWLAVRSSQRRRGVGHALLAAIVDRWPTEPIEVVTFTADTAGGAPARRLYESHGFSCVGASGPAPDGNPRDLYVLRRDST